VIPIRLLRADDRESSVKQRSVMAKMDESQEASRARAIIVLKAMASSSGDPAAKRKLIREVCAGDPKARQFVRAVQSVYFEKEERIEI